MVQFDCIAVSQKVENSIEDVENAGNADSAEIIDYDPRDKLPA